MSDNNQPSSPSSPPAHRIPGAREVYDAAARIAGVALRTPVLHAESVDRWVGTPVLVKAESLQVTGSFKVRGALNRVGTFPDTVRDAGLLTVSAGNAALGAACAARRYGCDLTVVMPHNAVPEKLASVRAMGARVVTDGIVDASSAFARARQLEGDEALTFVHPFDDPMVIAGAATATLELLEDHPEVGTLYVPCSGGGLLAGALVAVKTAESDVEVVGVQPQGADTMVRSLAAGLPTRAPAINTIADGLTAPQPGDLNFHIIAQAQTRIVTVTDEQTLEALGHVLRDLRLVAEPSAAVGLAGIRADAAHDSGRGPAAFILSGSNASSSLLAKVLQTP